jgi:hypothetical protein
MNESPENKVCRACAETIKASARLCPFCQTRQHGWPVWRVAEIGSALLVCLVALSALFWFINDERRRREPQFALHRHELEVVRTSIEVARQTPESWLARFATNLWPTHQLNVRFLDAEGSPLATRTPERGVLVGPCFWLTGFVTNRGRYSWTAHYLEARFFDTQSNLVDIEQLSPSDRLCIPPRGEVAFRAPIYQSGFTNAGLTRQVRVQGASCVD